MILGAVAATAALASVQVEPSRFQPWAAIPDLPSVLLDYNYGSIGVAQGTARGRMLQGRMMWIDGGANLERINTEEKIVAVVERIARAGFNTVVLDVKPIVGYTLWPTSLAPKMTEWYWGKATMPVDFDPIPIFVRETAKHDLSFWCSLNPFSEGHFGARLGPEENVHTAHGPGFQKPEWQTVNYYADPVARVGDAVLPIHLNFREVPQTDEMLIAVPQATARPDLPEGWVAFALEFRTGRVWRTDGRTGLRLFAKGANVETLQRAADLAIPVRLDTVPVFLRIAERPNQLPLITNPFNPDVEKHALAFIEELATKYDIDGLIYDDRLRFGNMNADFSELTRRLFEEKVGHKLNWPDDVFKFTLTQRLTQGIQPGPYYDAWMVFRAQRMKDFVAAFRETANRARPGTMIGVYAGSWYGEYARFGTNYGSPELEAGFRYLTEAYRKTGFAELLDVLITGCYYPTPTIYEAMVNGTGVGTTVEAGAQLSNRVARDACWTYAGIFLDDFKDDPDRLARALQAATGASQGVMVFDLSHNTEYWWDMFDRGFRQRMKAPHQVPGLLDEVRRQRAAMDRAGYKEPPLIIDAGQSGVGF